MDIGDLTSKAIDHFGPRMGVELGTVALLVTVVLRNTTGLSLWRRTLLVAVPLTAYANYALWVHPAYPSLPARAAAGALAGVWLIAFTVTAFQRVRRLRQTLRLAHQTLSPGNEGNAVMHFLSAARQAINVGWTITALHAQYRAVRLQNQLGDPNAAKSLKRLRGWIAERDTRTPLWLRAASERLCGEAARVAGDAAVASFHFDRATAMYAADGHWTQAEVLLGCCDLAQKSDPARALELAEEAQAILEAADDRRLGKARGLGFVLFESQKRAERTELRKTLGYCQYWLGTLHLEAARLSLARDCLAQARSSYELTRSVAGTAMIDMALGRVYIRQLCLGDARAALERALGGSEVAAQSGSGNVRGLLGRICMLQGQFAAAARELSHGLVCFKESASGRAFIHLEQAELAMLSGDRTGAAARFEQALAEDASLLGYVWLGRAQLHLAFGQRSRSRAAQREAEQRFKKDNNPVGVLEAYCVRLERKIEEGDFEAADIAVSQIDIALEPIEHPLLGLQVDLLKARLARRRGLAVQTWDTLENTYLRARAAGARLLEAVIDFEASLAQGDPGGLELAKDQFKDIGAELNHAKASWILAHLSDKQEHKALQPIAEALVRKQDSESLLDYWRDEAEEVKRRAKRFRNTVPPSFNASESKSA